MPPALRKSRGPLPFFLPEHFVCSELEGTLELINSFYRCTLRVYAGPNTPDYLLQDAEHSEKHLPVPVTDKNFLISPPGSPPVGWEPIHEDPPNTVTLADDLMRALENLAMEQKLDESQPSTPTHSRGGSLSTPGNPSEPSDHLVIPTSPDKSHPAVFVRNMDAHEPSPAGQFPGITIANSPNGVRRSPTASPISHVKATVESMGGSGTSSPSRITPTARPPL